MAATQPSLRRAPPRKTATTATPAYRPRPGVPVKDAKTGFVGLYQTTEHTMENGRPVGTAYIRPYGGGCEVEAAPRSLRRPTPDEIDAAQRAARSRRRPPQAAAGRRRRSDESAHGNPHSAGQAQLGGSRGQVVGGRRPARLGSA